MNRLPGDASALTATTSVRKRNRLWLVALGIALVVQLTALYWPTVPAGPAVPGLDKLVHICIFAAPALAALMAGISAPWVFGILAMHAPASELIQHFALAHRTGDVLDLMADFAGIALGALAYMVWNRRQP